MSEVLKDRLDSWKEVSAYLGRSIRTLQRWEATAGLPVHRLEHEKRGSIYAYKSELDAWWSSRGTRLQADDGTPVAPAGKRKLAWAAFAVAILAVAGVAIWRSPLDAPSLHSAVVLPFTSLQGTELFPSFSPDGQNVAFTWDGPRQDNRDVYVKPMGAGEPLRLTTHPGPEAYPTFSPDGRWIAYRRWDSESGRMEIFVVSVAGGAERKVGEVSPFGPNELHSPVMAWTSDAKWLILPDRPRSTEPVALFLMSVESGEKRRLTHPPETVFGDFCPAVSRDGGALAFIRMVTVGTSTLLRQALSENFGAQGEPLAITDTMPELQNPMWAADGQGIFYVTGTEGIRNLWRVQFSGSRKPQPVNSPGRIGIHLSLAPQGNMLIYSDAAQDRDIWRLDLHGGQGNYRPPVRLISSTFVEDGPDYSPDGTKIVFASSRSGHVELWVSNSDGSGPIQLTSFGGPLTGFARWSPDGKQIVFGNDDLYTIQATGGETKILEKHPAREVLASWSRDGKSIYFGSNRSGQYQIWRVPAAGGPAVQMTSKGGYCAFESSDGFLYYAKNREATDLWRIPSKGGEETRVAGPVRFHQNFHVAGDTLYYLTGPDSSGNSRLRRFRNSEGQVREVATIQKDIRQGLSVSQDERWVLFTVSEQGSGDLVLVKNFR